jgi:hypothetical protein
MSDKAPLCDNGDKDNPAMSWKKSSYSMSNGQCLEAAQFRDGWVGVRDSKAAGEGPTLCFAPRAWDSFTNAVRTM